MYKVNLFLKIIIAVLLTISVIITSNYYVLFTCVLITIIIYLVNKKLLLSIIGIIIMFFIFYESRINIIILKPYLIFSFSYLFTFFLSIRQKNYFLGKYYKYSNVNRRELFYVKNYNNILNNIKDKSSSMYKNELSLENKLRRDLERSYLQSRIRFFGFKNIGNFHYESRWKKFDYVLLIITIIFFLIIVLV